MKISEERVWAGSEQTLKSALEAEEAAVTRIAAGQYPEDDNEEECPYLLTVEDGIATVQIKGSLNNDSGIWNQIFGMTGYPDIREALMTAATDAGVSQIFLDIDSGGGAVSGVEDTAKLIRLINDNVKPVVAYTDGAMCSAAYWLGAAAGEVYAGKTAILGSIGVISTHMERSKMLADAGIGVTVVRSGKYKALANSVEKLSPEGKAQIQKLVDAADAVFVEAISGFRGKSLDYTKEYMAQGREFVGMEAVDIGIVDGITSFDALMSELKAKSIDASNNFMDNRGKQNRPFAGEAASTLAGEVEMKNKTPLTAQMIAAIAAGAAAPVEAKADEAQASTEVELVQAEAQGAAASTEASTETQVENEEVVQAAVDQKEDKMSATVQLLNDQLAAKDALLIEAKVENSKLQEKLTEALAAQDPMFAIVAQATDNLRVALGGSALGAEGMTAAQLLAEHGRLAEQFKSKFKAGGVAAVAGSDATVEKTQIDPRQKARVNAVRYQGKK